MTQNEGKQRMCQRMIIVGFVPLFALVLTGCPQGQPTLCAFTLFQFSATACTELPPAERPPYAAPNCGGLQPCCSGPIRVMTYNVLCSICFKEDYEGWCARVPGLQDTVARYDADLIALQEPSSALSVATIMGSRLNCYGVLFHAAGLLTYPDSTLLYRKERFELLDEGRFWLGVLPCHLTLPGWQLATPRYVNWARLRERTSGFEFLFVANHFDANRENREQSALVLTAWLAPLAEHVPIIIAGDFNSNPESTAYASLQGGNGAPMHFENTFDVASARKVARNTEPDLDITGDNDYARSERIIDHIMFAGPVDTAVTNWMQDKYLYGDGAYAASDHWAIIADLAMTMR